VITRKVLQVFYNKVPVPRACLKPLTVGVEVGIYTSFQGFPNTYDHRIMKTRLPVRSALFKHDTGGLVVKWVTISESLLLYVFAHQITGQKR
jgi:hypothetical protein